jgi:predicted nucleic acid-binding protein
MNDIVVDSSVVAKWILAENDSAQAQRLFNDTIVNGGRLIVLDLVFPEVSNAIWKRARQNLITPVEATKSLNALTRLPVSIEPTFPLLSNGFSIATRYNRAVYDALFVALAQDLGFPGVTADEPLYNAVHLDLPFIHLLRTF